MLDTPRIHSAEVLTMNAPDNRIPFAEQEARRALKLERKAIDRAISTGRVFQPSGIPLPTRWNLARRMRHNARAYEGQYRAAAERISTIQRMLTEPRS